VIGLVITLVIIKITWDSWRVVSSTEPGERIELPDALSRAANGQQTL